MSQQVIREVCVDSLAGVRAAAAAGAERVELCSDLDVGGLTPGGGLLRAARAVPGVALVVLVRPRPGDFHHDAHERDTLRAEVEWAGEAGADGVAVGALRADGTLDLDTLAELVERARPMEVCVHRAFDVVPDQLAALEQLVDLDIERVLTSGGEQGVLDGLPRLVELCRAAGERITVMPGGGVRADNAARVLAATGARAIHFSARGSTASRMTHRNPRCSLVAAEPPVEHAWGCTDAERLAALMSVTGR